MQPPHESMVLSGLHAYLDGNGGAAGTQTVRMAVYQVFEHPEFGFPDAIPIEQAIALPCARAPRAAQSQRWWV
jgi:hypothetical protein